MSLPPERISIKRRRQEEPVETLYLEHGTGPDKKRRVTDFYFQRLREAVIAPISQQEKPPSQTTAPGIPSIRWTSPGDQKKDFEKLKAALKAKTEDDKAPKTRDDQRGSSPLASDVGTRSAPGTPFSSELLLQARRFHLTRHLSSVLSPNPSGGIRKSKNMIRPPLATFVERQGATFTYEQNPLYSAKPVDKVLEVPKGDGVLDHDSGSNTAVTPETLSNSKRHATSTFLQPGKTARTGTSIKDHPSTWDHGSDRLADELAALAMEFDPDMQQQAEQEKQSRYVPDSKDMVMPPPDREDDYIYETYIRVQYDDETPHAESIATALSNIGVLVIEDDDEEFWQKYVDSDDDTEWDEEDSNAEDNPSNDYPEDEVSSDDEYGYNPYKYHHASDEESFDADEIDDDNIDNSHRNRHI